MPKATTTYTPIPKPITTYIGNPAAAAGVTLDSMTVPLNSLAVFLHGYTTATPPNLINDKPVTTYTEL